MKIDNLNKDKTYLVYVRGTKFVSRGIQFFMRLYALRFNRKWRKPYNHADLVHKEQIWGSQAEGFINRPLTEGWEKASRLAVFELEPKLNSKKIDSVLEKYQYRRYDFKNFIDFIVKFFTGKWSGHTKEHADKALYCIESVHRVMEEIGVEPVLENAWDNDPEESYQWALDNLKLYEEFINKKKNK